MSVAWIALASLCVASAALARPPKARKPAETTPSAAAEPASPEPSQAGQGEPASAAPASDSPLSAAPAGAELPAAEPTSQPPAAAAEAATSERTAPTERAPEALTALSSELASLMDDLVQARTRAAVLGKTLFKTVIRVRVQNLAQDSASLSKLVLKLDGAPIYRGDAGTLRGDEAHQVFEGFVAPGPHVLTAEIDQDSRDDSAYGYSLRETYRFQALQDKRNELALILSDDSDLASEFPDEQEGEYDVRIRLRVRTEELTER